MQASNTQVLTPMLHQLLRVFMPDCHTIMALAFPSILCITPQITTCMDHVDRLGECLRDLQTCGDVQNPVC